MSAASVLVTGAAGFIGGHVVDLLAERGTPPRAAVMPGEPGRRLAGLGAEVVTADMRDRASLAAAVEGMDTVLHCAARTGSWGPRAEFEAVNVRGLADLLDVSLAAGVRRFVHVSSIVVYGTNVGGAADESAPLRVERHNPYSWSKVMGEEVVGRYVRERSAPVTVVRPGWVYGPRDTGSFGRFASMIEKGGMIVMGSGLNRVPLVYVADVAQGILMAGEADAAKGRAYTLVNDDPVTPNDYFRAIARELGAPPPRFRLPFRLALGIAWGAETAFRLTGRKKAPPITRHGVSLMAGENRLSIARARADLGFAPRVGLTEGVRRSVEWYRAGRDGKTVKRVRE
jgi:nucleoside-diphosphate-sugar epimerase